MVSYISNELHNEGTEQHTDSRFLEKEVYMSNESKTWSRVKYTLLSIIPWPLFKGIALVVMSAVSLAVTSGVIAKGGTPEEAQTHLVEFLTSDVAIKFTALVQIIVFVLALLIMFKGLKRNDYGSPVKAFSRFTFPGVILLMTGGAFVILMVLGMLSTLAPALFESYRQLMQDSGLTGFTAASILTTIVIAPFTEETLFRGISFDLLKKAGWSFWVVNIIQALLFGLTHMNMMDGIMYGIEYFNIVQGAYAFILGLFLGYIRERTGSIWPTILGHMVFNFVGTFVVAWLGGLGETVGSICMIGGGIIFTILGFVLMELKRGKATNE